jgi:hypothetical protein
MITLLVATQVLCVWYIEGLLFLFNSKTDLRFWRQFFFLSNFEIPPSYILLDYLYKTGMPTGIWILFIIL